MAVPAPGKVVAVLGPTNTGKTHYAIERMLAHKDGMIGLPLRLLAREVYDKVVRAKGPAAAALITGEEKIAPDTARYFICTVEAMPLDLGAQFVAVDEVQLARDPDRGHVFTDRILRARGIGETLLLGSDTMRPMIKRLVPQAEITRRERLSTLRYAGHKKLTKLPKRTAIVAFSAEEVYAIAELIRRQRGGAAVVMGALSPRTRNAQVALYQSGEVDFLVATDAIGMGLNMDVDHVAFASRAKFDGRRSRPLRADEIAQIAGRAGRFQTDGTFGEAGACLALDEETIERVEGHAFEPVEAVEWRNPALDFSSVEGLLRALAAPPRAPGLLRARGASDEEALKRISEDGDLMDAVRRPEDVRRLWDACLTPDFRKVTPDEHAVLVGQLATHLLGPKRRIPQDWIAREVERLDKSEGDLDALQARLAHIRTWTYAANRPDWVDDCEHWRARTRAVEDRLSDALHTLLTQRFIDRRTSALVRGLKADDLADVEVSEGGAVTLDGHYLGKLEGLRFRPDVAGDAREGRALRYAARRALAPELARRLGALSRCADAALRLDREGVLHWDGVAVAAIAPGGSLLSPVVRLLGDDVGEPSQRAAAQARMAAWLRARLERELPGLIGLERALAAGALAGAARGLAYQLLEGCGAIDRAGAADLIAGLTQAERAGLRGLNVRFGRHTVYLAGLERGRRLLATLRQCVRAEPGFPVPRREVIAPHDPALAWAAYAAAGYRPAGPVALRIERIERFARRAALGADKAVGFALDDGLAAELGCEAGHRAAVLSALGYRRLGPKADPEAGEAASPQRWRFAPARKPAPKAAPIIDTPFAALAALAQAAEPAARRRRRR